MSEAIIVESGGCAPPAVVCESHFERMARFEAAIRAYLPPGECPVTHHFAGGVYAREMFAPKGTVLTGKIHKHANINVMLRGEMVVVTEAGVRHLVAPQFIVSPPGTKRAAIVIEDAVWITFHGTNETDVDKIEQEFIAQTPEEYEAFVRSTDGGAR